MGGRGSCGCPSPRPGRSPPPLLRCLRFFGEVTSHRFHIPSVHRVTIQRAGRPGEEERDNKNKKKGWREESPPERSHDAFDNKSNVCSSGERRAKEPEKSTGICRLGWMSTYHRGKSCRIRSNTASARGWKPSNPSIFYSSLKGFPQRYRLHPSHSSSSHIDSTDPFRARAKPALLPLPLRSPLPDGPDQHAQSAASAAATTTVLLVAAVPVSLLVIPLRTRALFRLAQMHLWKGEG